MLNYTDNLFILLFLLLWAWGRFLRKWPAAREWSINLFSLFIIATWGLFGLALFITVLLVNYVGATILIRLSGKSSKIALGILIAANIATLATFKYANFFGSNLHSLTGWEIATFPLGIPIAISFYTFHIISYLVDVRAGKIRHAGFRQYLFYLSFFPHVVAGPIVRGWQLLPQIGHVRKVRTDLFMGFHFFVVGFFLKMFCANHIAQSIDPIWANTADFSPSLLEKWSVAILYYFQIYADFAGYSLMALGMARILGYRLPMNFRAPMIARNIQEFWQRWHITLSRWLRDYLYIPLGGNRVSPWRAAGNVMTTMLLGGLWHGAGWGFVVWGGMHGGGIVIARLFRTFTKASTSLHWVAFWLITQVWVTLAWVFFRAPDVTFAIHFIQGMFVPESGWYHMHSLIAALVIFTIPVILHHAAPFWIKCLGRRRLPQALGILTGFLMVFDLVLLSPGKTFIYFKF